MREKAVRDCCEGKGFEGRQVKGICECILWVSGSPWGVILHYVVVTAVRREAGGRRRRDRPAAAPGVVIDRRTGLALRAQQGGEVSERQLVFPPRVILSLIGGWPPSEDAQLMGLRTRAERGI